MPSVAFRFQGKAAEQKNRIIHFFKQIECRFDTPANRPTGQRANRPTGTPATPTNRSAPKISGLLSDSNVEKFEGM